MDTDETQLLSALTELSRLGPIEAVGKGPNSVGKTLQESLGIAHTVNARNSLFNFTVTATTSGLNSTGRTNLFACVPDWSISKIKSSKELVEKFGKEDLSRGYVKSLFCTSTSAGPNSFRLLLRANSTTSSLEECSVDDDVLSPVVTWDVSRLELKLADLLNKTAIVTALAVDQGGKKAFHYRYLDILENPKVSAFLELIEVGSITIDHCISIKQGSNGAREQGPLFKIRVDAREDLFQNVKRFDLMSL
jgi:hypothetical protein